MSLNTSSSKGNREKAGKGRETEKLVSEPRTTMKQFAGFLSTGSSEESLDDGDSGSIRRIKKDTSSGPSEPLSPRALYQKLKSKKEAEMEKIAAVKEDQAKRYSYESAHSRDHSTNSNSEPRDPEKLKKKIEPEKKLIKKIKSEIPVEMSKPVSTIDYKGKSPSVHSLALLHDDSSVLKHIKSNPNLLAGPLTGSTNLLRATQSVELLSPIHLSKLRPDSMTIASQKSIASSRSSLSIDSIDYDYNIESAKRLSEDQEEQTMDIVPSNDFQGLYDAPVESLKRPHSLSMGLLLMKSTDNLNTSQYHYPVPKSAATESSSAPLLQERELSLDDPDILGVMNETGAFYVPLKNPEHEQTPEVAKEPEFQFDILGVALDTIEQVPQTTDSPVSFGKVPINQSTDIFASATLKYKYPVGSSRNNLIIEDQSANNAKDVSLDSLFVEDAEPGGTVETAESNDSPTPVPEAAIDKNIEDGPLMQSIDARVAVQEENSLTFSKFLRSSRSSDALSTSLKFAYPVSSSKSNLAALDEFARNSELNVSLDSLVEEQDSLSINHEEEEERFKDNDPLIVEGESLLETAPLTIIEDKTDMMPLIFMKLNKSSDMLSTALKATYPLSKSNPNLLQKEKGPLETSDVSLDNLFNEWVSTSMNKDDTSELNVVATLELDQDEFEFKLGDVEEILPPLEERLGSPSLQFMKLSKSSELLSSTDKYKNPLSSSKNDLLSIDPISAADEISVSLDSLFNEEVPETLQEHQTIILMDNDELIAVLNDLEVPTTPLTTEKDAETTFLLLENVHSTENLQKLEMAMKFMKLNKSLEVLATTEKYKYGLSSSKNDLNDSSEDPVIGTIHQEVSLDSISDDALNTNEELEQSIDTQAISSAVVLNLKENAGKQLEAAEEVQSRLFFETMPFRESVLTRNKLLNAAYQSSTQSINVLGSFPEFVHSESVVNLIQTTTQTSSKTTQKQRGIDTVTGNEEGNKQNIVQSGKSKLQRELMQVHVIDENDRLRKELDTLKRTRSDLISKNQQLQSLLLHQKGANDMNVKTLQSEALQYLRYHRLEKRAAQKYIDKMESHLNKKTVELLKLNTTQKISITDLKNMMQERDEYSDSLNESVKILQEKLEHAAIEAKEKEKLSEEQISLLKREEEGSHEAQLALQLADEKQEKERQYGILQKISKMLAFDSSENLEEKLQEFLLHSSSQKSLDEAELAGLKLKIASLENVLLEANHAYLVEKEKLEYARDNQEKVYQSEIGSAKITISALEKELTLKCELHAEEKAELSQRINLHTYTIEEHRTELEAAKTTISALEKGIVSKVDLHTEEKAEMSRQINLNASTLEGQQVELEAAKNTIAALQSLEKELVAKVDLHAEEKAELSRRFELNASTLEGRQVELEEARNTILVLENDLIKLASLAELENLKMLRKVNNYAAQLKYRRLDRKISQRYIETIQNRLLSTQSTLLNTKESVQELQERERRYILEIEELNNGGDQLQAALTRLMETSEVENTKMVEEKKLLDTKLANIASKLGLNNDDSIEENISLLLMQLGNSKTIAEDLSHKEDDFKKEKDYMLGRILELKNELADAALKEKNDGNLILSKDLAIQSLENALSLREADLLKSEMRVNTLEANISETTLERINLDKKLNETENLLKQKEALIENLNLNFNATISAKNVELEKLNQARKVDAEIHEANLRQALSNQTLEFNTSINAKSVELEKLKQARKEEVERHSQNEANWRQALSNQTLEFNATISAKNVELEKLNQARKVDAEIHSQNEANWRQALSNQAHESAVLTKSLNSEIETMRDSTVSEKRRNLSDLEDRTKQLESEKLDLQNTIETKNQEINQLEKKESDLITALNKSQSELKSIVRKHAAELAQIRFSHDSSIAETESKLSDLKEELRKSNLTVTEREKRIEKLDRERAKLEQTMKSIHATVDFSQGLEEQIRELELQVSKKELEVKEILKTHSKEKSKMKKHIAELESQLQSLQVEHNDSLKALKKAEEVIDDQKVKLLNAKRSLLAKSDSTMLEDKIHQLESVVESTEQIILKATQDNQKLLQQNNNLQRELTKVQEQALHDKDSELKTLRNENWDLAAKLDYSGILMVEVMSEFKERLQFLRTLNSIRLRKTYRGSPNSRIPILRVAWYESSHKEKPLKQEKMSLVEIEHYSNRLIQKDIAIRELRYNLSEANQKIRLKTRLMKALLAANDDLEQRLLNRISLDQKLSQIDIKLNNSQRNQSRKDLAQAASRSYSSSGGVTGEQDMYEERIEKLGSIFDAMHSKLEESEKKRVELEQAIVAKDASIDKLRNQRNTVNTSNSIKTSAKSSPSLKPSPSIIVKNNDTPLISETVDLGLLAELSSTRADYQNAQMKIKALKDKIQTYENKFSSKDIEILELSQKLENLSQHLAHLQKENASSMTELNNSDIILKDWVQMSRQVEAQEMALSREREKVTIIFNTLAEISNYAPGLTESCKATITDFREEWLKKGLDKFHNSKPGNKQTEDVIQSLHIMKLNFAIENIKVKLQMTESERDRILSEYDSFQANQKIVCQGYLNEIATYHLRLKKLESCGPQITNDIMDRYQKHLETQKHELSQTEIQGAERNGILIQKDSIKIIVPGKENRPLLSINGMNSSSKQAEITKSAQCLVNRVVESPENTRLLEISTTRSRSGSLIPVPASKNNSSRTVSLIPPTSTSPNNESLSRSLSVSAQNITSRSRTGSLIPVPTHSRSNSPIHSRSGSLNPVIVDSSNIRSRTNSPKPKHTTPSSPLSMETFSDHPPEQIKVRLIVLCNNLRIPVEPSSTEHEMINLIGVEIESLHESLQKHNMEVAQLHRRAKQAEEEVNMKSKELGIARSENQRLKENVIETSKQSPYTEVQLLNEALEKSRMEIKDHQRSLSVQRNELQAAHDAMQQSRVMLKKLKNELSQTEALQELNSKLKEQIEQMKKGKLLSEVHILPSGDHLQARTIPERQSSTSRSNNASHERQSSTSRSNNAAHERQSSTSRPNNAAHERQSSTSRSNNAVQSDNTFIRDNGSYRDLENSLKREREDFRALNLKFAESQAIQEEMIKKIEWIAEKLPQGLTGALKLNSFLARSQNNILKGSNRVLIDDSISTTEESEVDQEEEMMRRNERILRLKRLMKENVEIRRRAFEN